VNNYRGISLCPVISKLFEQCLLDKFEAFTDTCILCSELEVSYINV